MSEKVERLVQDASREGIEVFEWDLREMKAAVLEQDGEYAVFLDREVAADSTECACVLAHEIGHCKTGTTHRVASPFDLIGKHEYIADKYAVEKLVPKRELRKAQRAGLVEAWQLAEHFGVTEAFIRRAVYLYGLRDEK